MYLIWKCKGAIANVLIQIHNCLAGVYLFFVRNILKFILNKYIITAALFLLLMLFFDQNDWFTQQKREKDLSETQAKIDHLQQEILRMNEELNQLQQNPDKLEQIAREKYHEKRDGEDVYIIITDTVKANKP